MQRFLPAALQVLSETFELRAQRGNERDEGLDRKWQAVMSPPPVAQWYLALCLFSLATVITNGRIQGNWNKAPTTVLGCYLWLYSYIHAVVAVNVTNWLLQSVMQVKFDWLTTFLGRDFSKVRLAFWHQFVFIFQAVITFFFSPISYNLYDKHEYYLKRRWYEVSDRLP